MPDLQAFATFARAVGAVPPVPPAPQGGGTGLGSGIIQQYQCLENPVPPVPPVPPQNGLTLRDLDRRDDYEERAAIMEYCGGLSRAEAEYLAWIDVFGSTPVTRQTDQETPA